VKVGVALDAVESGRGGGTFYWASDGAEQMEWRRSPAVSAPSRQQFSKVKWGKRGGRDTELVWGKRRRLAGISIKLHPTTGGVTMARGAAALWSGGWRRLGRPRQEDDARGGPGWSGRLGRMPRGPTQRENKKIEMRHKDDWAEMVLGCVEKKKKVFQILIQGIIFKSKF
jgi:hypothetical protein